MSIILQRAHGSKNLLEEACLSQLQHLSDGIGEHTDSQEGKGGHLVAFQLTPLKLGDNLFYGLQVRSKEEGVVYIGDEDHTSTVVQTGVKL